MRPRTKKTLIVTGIYTVGTYMTDAVIRPKAIRRRARLKADEVGKPLLHLTTRKSLRTKLFGASQWGDTNLVVGTSGVGPGTPGTVDLALSRPTDPYELPFADGTFGAIIVSNVMEDLERPLEAVAEWQRVVDPAGGLFVLTPSWWAPHAWLDPAHHWAVVGGRGVRLWWWHGEQPGLEHAEDPILENVRPVGAGDGGGEIIDMDADFDASWATRGDGGWSGGR